ncbi:angiopoietin-4-like [Saccostrea echinata]|uniref:angiopoietin-4-like n=1 Tax=Saccostrea echinata TaxID=191078 RepID=UPI002A7F1F8D|nr:angiopoietin-4-like [Saccostrea echinata]
MVNDMSFTTKDRDNDNYFVNCAVKYRTGGWWYSNCGYSDLNGVYQTSNKKAYKDKRYRDCHEILKQNKSLMNQNGVYTIYLGCNTPRRVFCDMTTNGGGWTVIQTRFDGSTDFEREWKDYKEGFGEASEEYWLGNAAIHDLTDSRKQELWIDLQTSQLEFRIELEDGGTVTVEFQLSTESSTLSIIITVRNWKCDLYCLFDEEELVLIYKDVTGDGLAAAPTSKLSGYLCFAL